MNARGHYGSTQVGQFYSSPGRYLTDPEYRRFEDKQFACDTGGMKISTQGEIILGVAAALIIGIGVVGIKRGVRFM
jgi:hypothetical protein